MSIKDGLIGFAAGCALTIGSVIFVHDYPAYQSIANIDREMQRLTQHIEDVQRVYGYDDVLSRCTRALDFPYLDDLKKQKEKLAARTIALRYFI